MERGEIVSGYTRSYTNDKGEVITINEKHIETAIKIKLELQKASPSRRTNWALHKKLMEQEGFFDSCTCESYRCLIKDEQRKRGLLPSASKHTDMVASSKLESIKQLVGELAYEKRTNQTILRELNKVQREIIDNTFLFEQIGNAFKNHDFSQFRFNTNNIKQVNGSVLAAMLADLHTGAIVNNHLNVYNYEIAQRRLQMYLNEILLECKRLNISKVFVMNLGDVIEHAVMRFAQAYNVEFPFSEQIVRASDLIIKFLLALSEHVEVEYAGIAGNHDRITDKDKNIYGDHVVKVINFAIRAFIENTGIKNIKFEEAQDYQHSKEINGVHFKFVHGDLDNIKNENLLAKHSSMDGIDYDYLVMGHYHHHRVIEVGLNKSIVVCGSLKGVDDYAIKNRVISSPSQTMFIVREDGKVDVRKVVLDCK